MQQAEQAAPPPELSEPAKCIGRLTITWVCEHCKKGINVESMPILMNMLKGHGSVLACPHVDCKKPVLIVPPTVDKPLVQLASPLAMNREARRRDAAIARSR